MIKTAQSILEGEETKEIKHPFLLRLLTTVLLLFLVFLTALTIVYLNKLFIFAQPKNYEECIKKLDSVIQESYPEVCITKNGTRFIRKLTDEEIKSLESSQSKTNQENAQSICGGITGRLCPPGYICKLSGNYPDALGLCQKN